MKALNILKPPLKIIQILHHSPSVLSADFQQVMYDGWHARFGRELFKRTNYEVECLTFDPSVKNAFTAQKDGIIYRAFPSSMSYAFLYEYSRELIRYLKKVSSERNDTIFHIHGFPGIMTYAIASKFRNNVVVIQDHGGQLSGWNFGWSFLGKYSLRNVDFFFTVSEILKEELIKYIGVDPKRIKVQTMGVDTNFFRPIPRSKCREILGLPADKYLVIYVGRFYDFKGLPLLVKIIRRLKTKYDVELIAVGGYQNDSLFTHVKREIPYSFGRIQHEILPYYYNAANVFAWFWKDVRYGGPGVSLMEAMACNISIVSNTLIYSKVNKELSREKLEEKGCYIPYNIRELEFYIEKALTKNNCKTRDLAKKYFSWDAIISSTQSIYKNLLNVKT